MEKLVFNPDNKKYYSEEFIKGFECGAKRQFNADMNEREKEMRILKFFCDRCGKEFKPEEGENSFTIKAQNSIRYRIERVGADDNYFDLCKECKEDFIHWLKEED